MKVELHLVALYEGDFRIVALNESMVANGTAALLDRAHRKGLEQAHYHLVGGGAAVGQNVPLPESSGCSLL